MHQQHNPQYNTKISNVVTDAVILGRADWRRIKQDSIHLTAAQQMELYQQEDARKKQTLRAIKDQRSGLLEAEREKQALRKMQATQREMDEREEALAVAEAKGNEELDEVKTMNSHVTIARILTMRDRQKAENLREVERLRQREIADAEMLEEGRHRAVQIYRDREEMLAEQRRKGGEMLVAQMEEKRRNANLERERREREIEEMKRVNQAARAEELRIAEERRNRSREFLQDCLAANAVAMRRKQRETERNLEEGQMMVEYQRDKAAREEEYERQIAAQKAAKEREIAELRKKQQRTIDLKEQQDALRARRIEEEKERQAREKELADSRRMWELKEEQEKDRQQSMALKQRRIGETREG
jgi:hypothetical protein